MRKKVSKKPVKARRRWVINPRTRVAKSKKAYNRTKEKPRAFLEVRGEEKGAG